MEFVPILRRLWRRRLALAIAAFVALAAGVAIGPGPPARSGMASARVVLDTPESQIVSAAPEGADSLLWRAALLAHRTATEDARDRIAKAAGVPPAQLVIVDPVLDEPAAPTTLPLAASEAAAVRPEPYALTVRYDLLLPIISLEAHAPDRAGAERLAKAAQAELIAAGAPDADGPQGFTIAAMGTPESHEELKPPPPAKAIAAAVFVFLLGSAGIAAYARMRRSVGRRRVQPA